LKTKRYSIGFSPCPNDTFIFDALVNHKIDTGDLSFDAVLEDVETLNQWAMEGRLDVTKISYGVLPLVLDQYILLTSGGALGSGVGPLLISAAETTIQQVDDCLVALPGEHTTAHLLFTQAFPRAVKKVFLRYDAIEDFVLQGKGLGVIIHENRFTYEQRGLKKIIDLGDYWEKETGNPIPLGGIVMRRDTGPDLQSRVNDLIRKSIEMAWKGYPELNEFIRMHSQEMSEKVMRKHIELYVNDYSIDLGTAGKNAVVGLLRAFTKNHIRSWEDGNIFIG
jgi:1,4-dihydroxy-6-naphthoate synthase